MDDKVEVGSGRTAEAGIAVACGVANRLNLIQSCVICAKSLVMPVLLYLQGPAWIRGLKTLI